jgi:hypothetical protein
MFRNPKESQPVVGLDFARFLEFVSTRMAGRPIQLYAESGALLGVLFETLKRILAISSRATQPSALHGLGHLYHPQVHGAVQRFNRYESEKVQLEMARTMPRAGVCGRCGLMAIGIQSSVPL